VLGVRAASCNELCLAAAVVVLSARAEGWGLLDLQEHLGRASPPELRRRGRPFHLTDQVSGFWMLCANQRAYYCTKEKAEDLITCRKEVRENKGSELRKTSSKPLYSAPVALRTVAREHFPVCT
jgi:hypothetical protein